MYAQDRLSVHSSCKGEKDLLVLPVASLLSSVKAVEKLFKKYAGKDQKLTLHEATKLFNSEDFRLVSKKVGLEGGALACIL